MRIYVSVTHSFIYISVECYKRSHCRFYQVSIKVPVSACNFFLARLAQLGQLNTGLWYPIDLARNSIEQNAFCIRIQVFVE